MRVSPEKRQNRREDRRESRGDAPAAAKLEALRLDARAVHVARGQGALELALGRMLLALFAGDRLLQLGYSQIKDYARECLGVPTRTVRAWTELARGLETRPVLRRAVVAGRVSPRKAREILAAATGDDEGRWVAAAMKHTLAELREMLRGAGHDPPDAFEVESLVLQMTPPQQDRLDAAIGVARNQLGPAAPRWQCLEVICQEWLSSFAAWAPEGEAEAGPPGRAEAGPAPVPEADPALLAQLVAIDDAYAVLARGGDGEEDTACEDARTLQARVEKFMAARREYDAAFGPLAGALDETRAWETLGYESLDDYARERLGMSARTVKQRAWLERRIVPLPELREALASGRVTYSKALLIAKSATPVNVTARIEDAASTTWQQLERESTAEEDRQDRAAGVRRLWGPTDAARTVIDAISCAQALVESLCEVQIGAGEALALVADHFADVWGRHATCPSSPKEKRKKVPRRRQEVLARTDGLCSVPGCSRAAVHVHHIVFRSQGGKKEEWNETGTCNPHHLHGIHRGYLTVRGRAGEVLVWEFGTGEAVPLQTWITKGGDDVRRVG